MMVKQDGHRLILKPALCPTDILHPHQGAIPSLGKHREVQPCRSLWALLSALGISGVGCGSMSHEQGGKQIFLSLHMSQQRDSCPIADSQDFWFILFSSQTVAFPNVYSSGAFAPDSLTCAQVTGSLW